MVITDWTLAIERLDDGGARFNLHHGGMNLVFEANADQAADMGAMLSSRPPVPGDIGGISRQSSGDNRPDGSENPADRAPFAGESQAAPSK